MTGGPRVVDFLLGFAVATGVMLAFEPSPAHGQILDPAPHRQSTPRRPPPPPPLEGETTPQLEGAAGGPWSTEVQANPGETQPEPVATQDLETQELVQFEEELRSEEPGQSQEAQAQELVQSDIEVPADILGEEHARLKAAARVPQDGDLSSVAAAPALEAGIINIAQPSVLPGEGLTEVDLRSPQDIAGFAGTDAGYDPLLLEALELNPVFSDRQPRQFEPDPFAPLGVRLGSFTLFTSLEADGDYNSNLFASPVALGDVSLEVRPAARLASNWSTHALELRASGDLSYHDKYPSEDNRAYLVEALGRLDVTSRTDLQGAVSREYAQESRNAINASSVGTRPNITVDRARGAFNHRFNRLSVRLRGAIVDTSYSTDVFDGMVESNSDRDYILYEEAVRPKWELYPTLALFTDVAVNQRDYSIAAFTDGINRSSTGERYRVGVSFGDMGAFLRGDVSLGYGRQTPDSPQLEVIDGLLIDANLSWLVTPLTTVLFTASTDVAETTTEDSGGVLEHNYAIAVSHNISTRLIGSAGVSYFTRDFVGAGINENQLTAATGLEYYLSREAVLFGRYQHTVFDTTTPNSNYTVEEVQVGVRLRQ